MPRFYLTILAGASLFGCATPPARVPTTRPDVRVVSLCADLDYAIPAWTKEIAQYHTKAVAVFVHGDTYQGSWWCLPSDAPAMPVDSLASVMTKLYPGYEIIFLSCNPGHFQPKFPIWYSPNTLVQVPQPGPTTKPFKGEVWTMNFGGFRRGKN